MPRRDTVVRTCRRRCRIGQFVVTAFHGGPLSAPPEANLTGLLLAWRGGDPAALDRLVPFVYTGLRQIAHRYMRQEARGHPLQTTALVHEAYLRLIDADRVDWHGRAHFYAIAAQVMRRILVEAARRRDAGKRGGDASHVALDEALVPAPGREADLVALDEALERLGALAPRKAKVVEVRYFGGLSVRETAEVLGVSEVTVMRDWQMAKRWLHHDLAAGSQPLVGDEP
jgi:RNA polymerase sigma-70 factor, ECF subfamily